VTGQTSLSPQHAERGRALLINSLGCAPSTVQPTDTHVPRISLHVPASSRAQLRTRMTRAISMTSSKEMLPACLMFLTCGEEGRCRHGHTDGRCTCHTLTSTWTPLRHNGVRYSVASSVQTKACGPRLHKAREQSAPYGLLLLLVMPLSVLLPLLPRLPLHLAPLPLHPDFRQSFSAAGLNKGYVK
jgi:hypothetical protein